MGDNDSVVELRARLAQLEAAEALAQSVFTAVPAVVMRLSLDGVIEYINRVLPEYRGPPLVGQPIYAFAPPDQHAVMRSALERTRRTREVSQFESIAQAPDGTRDWYSTSVGPIFEGDRVIGFSMISLNTSRSRMVEEALDESRAKLRVALDAGNVGVWRWNKVADEGEWDEKLCAMFGLTPAQAPTTLEAFLALVPTDQREAMRHHVEAAVQMGTFADFELRADLPSGTRWFIIKGGPLRDGRGQVIGLMGGVVDYTDRRVLEEQVRQVQKLDAVGQLSAGVAHNFNNMLAVIVPVLEVAKAQVNEATRAAVDDALSSALQASQLVRQLMVFAGRRGTVAVQLEELDLALTRAVELCRRTFDRRIALEVSGVSEAHGVPVDGGAIEQAVLNLLLNARDAVEQVETSTARIEVQVRRVPEGRVRQRHPEARGEHVEVRVWDNGTGMSEETRQRVFEPFFTTKPFGRGTGLGLPLAWATARSHHGYLDCDSAPGVGTTFSLLLPSAAQALPPSPPPRKLEGHGKRVLLIDDEEMVRHASARLLESYGFVVVTAASGEEGVRLARESAPDVALLDYSMPGQPPGATLAQLRALHPALPIVCFSGLGVTLEGATAHLLKPVSGQELVEAVLRAAEAAVP